MLRSRFLCPSLLPSSLSTRPLWREEEPPLPGGVAGGWDRFVPLLGGVAEGRGGCLPDHHRTLDLNAGHYLKTGVTC